MPLAAPFDLYCLVIITIMRVTSWCPYRAVRVFVAKILGNLSFYLSRGKRAAMMSALRTAFEDRLSERQLNKVVHESLCELWLQILGSIPGAIDSEAIRDAQVTGWRHLERALEAGNGVILWESGTFGSRSLTSQILSSKQVRVHQLRGANHLSHLDVDSATATWVRRKLIRPFFDQADLPYVAGLIHLPTGGDLSYGRALLQRLQRNAVLCVAAEGEYGAKRVTVPFLGSQISFSTGMVSLARISGAPIVPIVCTQRKDGTACLVVEDAIWVGRDGDPVCQAEQIIRHYAELMQRYILREPAAYRGWHLLVRGPST